MRIFAVTVHLSSNGLYYFYNQTTYMPKRCYGLCGIGNNELNKNISLGNLFVFITRRYNQIKLLHWARDGFAWYEKPPFDRPLPVLFLTMLFLFHTIIHVDQKPVYWNVYKSGSRTYFLEVLDNPHEVDITDFELDSLNNMASIELPPKELQGILEQIYQHNKSY